MRLELKDGNITKFNNTKKIIEKILFKTYDFPLFGGKGAGSAATNNGMLTNNKLINKIKAKKLKLRPGKKSKSLVKAKLELYSRYNTPLQCLVFILLGFSLGIKQGRGEEKGGSGLSMIIVAVYYVMFFTGLSLAKNLVLTPEIAIFFPVIIIFAVSYRYFVKLDWVS